MDLVAEERKSKSLRPAVFLDRDGTVTQLCGYVTTPKQVKLVPGAATSIRRLRTAEFQCILVTNQSAIGRGMLSAPELDKIHLELRRLLALEDTSLDGIYFCPLQPVVADERVIEYSDRKPGPGMLLKAAADNNLTLSQSWMVGDRISDVLAGINAGCRSIRVRSGHEYGDGLPEIQGAYDTVGSIVEATNLILNCYAVAGTGQ